MTADVERVVVDKRCMTANPVRFGNAFNVPQHESDESVALAPHSIHDRATVDADDTIMVDTEARRRFAGVGRVRRSDEQLARHATDTGAGRAIGAAFDEHCGRACGPGSAVRGKASRPGADDGNVNLCSSHVESSVVGYARSSLRPQSLWRRILKLGRPKASDEDVDDIVAAW
jgi:hypothetical protein